jgi:citronellol/citronellal dehydrogenase
MGPLSPYVALVTGASRGIGAAIAGRLAASGAAVAVTARTVAEHDNRLPGSLATTVEEITAAGGTAVALPADLSRPAERAALVDEVERRLGPVDILVNNAAITYFGPVADFDESRYRLMFEVQVHAPFQLSQRVVPAMRARGRGWILNISSGSSHHPPGPPYAEDASGWTVYGMCKAALERFTTGLAAEVHRDGIAVNVLSPSGLVLTPGVLYHRLHEVIPSERHEAVERTVDAAFALCTGDPRVLTGRVTHTAQVVEELGL